MRLMYKQIFCCILFASQYANAARILSGDADTANTTFTTSVSQVKKANTSGAVYASAGINGAGNFSISRLQENKTNFDPVITQKVKLVDGQTDNPLFDQAIATFDLFEASAGLFSTKEALLVTTEEEKQFIYFTEPATIVEGKDEPVSTIEKTSSLRDANGVEDAKVQQLVTDGIALTFAAVAPDNGNLGDANSGIALISRIITNAKTDDDQQVRVSIFDQVDPATGRPVAQPSALRLDGTEGIVNITANAVLENAVDMFYDKKLKRLFIALQVTSGVGGAARALVVGRVTSNRGLVLEPFLPDAVVADNNQIVATGNGNTSVALHKVRIMHTSTGLSYAIVVGNNGVTDDTDSIVFALPLISSGDNTGMLATKDAQPVTEFFTNDPKRFKSRDFIDAAQAADDVIRNNETEAQVGRGELLAGPITDVLILNDTVFVSVGNPQQEGLQGVYASRALFAANGKIKGWTSWQRAAGTTDQIFNLSFIRNDGATILFSGDDSNTVTVAQKTIWTEDTEVANAANQLLSDQQGSSQHLCSFLQTPGAPNLTLLSCADAQTVAFINTGEVENVTGLITPTNLATVIKFDNDTISQDVNNAFAIGISGPVTKSIGPITSTTIARNTNDDQTFIFVGGLRGIAVLANDDGTGVAGQIETGFAGLINGMNMQVFGDFSHVRKLIASENLLYALTDEQLVRINLNDINVVTDEVVSTVLATRSDVRANQETGSFVDVIISDSVAILATTGGLFKNQIGTSVATAINSQALNWQQIFLPESAGVPTRLTVSTFDNKENTFTQQEGGNIFALCTNTSNNRSRLHRLSVDIINMQPQVLLFDDVLIENMPTFFLNFGRHKNVFYSDGARCFVGQNKNSSSEVSLGLLNQKYPPRVGVANIGNQCIPVDANLAGSTEVSYIVSDLSQGQLVLASDHGLRVHV